MKKFVSACLMAGLLTCACRCGTRSVPINNNYPGDTEAQAQMLYDLDCSKAPTRALRWRNP